MKYKTGDHVKRPDSVHMAIASTVKGTSPIYAVVNPKDGAIEWLTEIDLDKMGFVKSTPSLKAWADAKEGDIVSNGHGYRKIVSRIGDCVLISLSPHSRKNEDTYKKIAEQISDLTDGEYDDTLETVLDMLPYTMQEAHQMLGPGGMGWRTVQYCALLGWELLRE